MKFLLKLAKFVAKFVIFLVALSACVRLYAWQERRGRQTCADRYLRSQDEKDLAKAKAINKERCRHDSCKTDFCRKQEKGVFA